METISVLVLSLLVIFYLLVFLSAGSFRRKAKKMNESVGNIEEEQRENAYKDYRAERIKEIRKGLSPMKVKVKDTIFEDSSYDVDFDIIIDYRQVCVPVLFKFLKSEAENNNYYFVSLTNNTNSCLSVLFYESEGRDHDWYCCNLLGKGSDVIKTIKEEYQDDCFEIAEKIVTCFVENLIIDNKVTKLQTIIKDGLAAVNRLKSSNREVDKKASDILMLSNYDELFEKKVSTFFGDGMLIVEYDLPSRDGFLSVKEYKYIATSKEISTKNFSESFIRDCYENTLYSICLRSVYELFFTDVNNSIKAITFNGFVTAINKATGRKERKCILSLQVSKEEFMQINLAYVEPKACFKSLKGVSAARLIDVSPVTPVLTLNKHDHRFIAGREVEVASGTNLASMGWEDFEQLVRGLFENEFSTNGGEVKVTQASRDGGVDAVVFDPDPLRGGKIVIQAKRYTNTVPVSAVRDLYGTVINEGANSGILITTSDYGHDSYDFAKDKPLKLLNGAHLLALLHKHGQKGYINIPEAKEQMKLEQE